MFKTSFQDWYCFLHSVKSVSILLVKMFWIYSADWKKEKSKFSQKLEKEFGFSLKMDGSPAESFLLLANGTRGAAAIGLITQILEAPAVYVFGELLDHPNIQVKKFATFNPWKLPFRKLNPLLFILQGMSSSPEGEKYLKLLELFAFGVYKDYLAQENCLPKLSDSMRKKLRLLTLASLATKV